MTEQGGACTRVENTEYRLLCIKLITAITVGISNEN